MNKEIFEAQLNEQLKELQKKFNDNPTILDYISRGLCQCYNNPQNGILVLGINPSYKNNDTYGYSFEQVKFDNNYFRSITTMLGDLAEKIGYLDLFPIKESDQGKFTVDIITNDACSKMLCDMVRNVQRKIEDLQPRLIILNNRDLGAFVGLHNKFTWMGYQFEEVSNPIEYKKVNFYRIIGIKSDNVSGIAQTNLIGTYVLHYGLYDSRHDRSRILQSEHVKQLWESFCQD